MSSLKPQLGDITEKLKFKLSICAPNFVFLSSLFLFSSLFYNSQGAQDNLFNSVLNVYQRI